MFFESMLEEIASQLAQAQQLAQEGEHEAAARLMLAVAEKAEEAARQQYRKAEELQNYLG